MILLVIIIYFIILAVLEFIFILLSKNNDKKNYIKWNNLNSLQENERNDYIKSNNLILNTCSNNVDIQNYIGKFYLESNYGFYINLDKWNLLESKKLYQFDMPVNIKIIKLDEQTDIIFHTDSNINCNNKE